MARKRTPTRDDMPLRNLALRSFIDSCDMSVKDFAEKIGMIAERINRLFRYDSHPGAKKRYPVVTDDVASAVAKAFNLPVDWLDKEVERLENERDEASTEADMPTQPSGDTRPRILNYAAAGNLTEAIEDNSEPQPVIKQLPNYDCTIIIRGDSMEPTYHSGDEIALLNITKTGFRQWGTPHVLNTSQGIVIKRIYADKENEGYKCVSDNEKYEPFTIPEGEIYGVYKIVGFVRWEQ